MIRSALLIDDEPLARIELRRLLLAHPDITIVGEASTTNEARLRLGQPDYDLVFLDVQLRGGSGFDLLDFIAPGTQIVFVTAFDRYAVRAFEVNALDYLLKPVTPDRLAATLHRLSKVTDRAIDELSDATRPSPPPAPESVRSHEANVPTFTLDDRVFVKTGNATRFVPIARIVSINSCENYTQLCLVDGTRLMALRTLKSWEDALPPDSFVRIHRQTLVNLTHVEAIERTLGEELLFRFTVPVPDQPASRRRISELRHRLTSVGLDRLLP